MSEKKMKKTKKSALVAELIKLTEDYLTLVETVKALGQELHERDSSLSNPSEKDLDFVNETREKFFLYEIYNQQVGMWASCIHHLYKIVLLDKLENTLGEKMKDTIEKIYHLGPDGVAVEGLNVKFIDPNLINIMDNKGFALPAEKFQELLELQKKNG